MVHRTGEMPEYLSDKDLIEITWFNLPQRVERVARFHVRLTFAREQGKLRPYVTTSEPVIGPHNAWDRLARYVKSRLEGVPLSDVGQLGLDAILTNLTQQMLLSCVLHFPDELEDSAEVLNYWGPDLQEETWVIE